jgi:hypothetical protein
VASDDPNTTRRHKVERARSSRCAGASSSCIREGRRWGGALWLASVAVGDFFHVRSTKVQNGTWCAEGVWRGCGHGGTHPPHDQQEHLLMCEILHLTLPTPLQRTPPSRVVGWGNSGHEPRKPTAEFCVCGQRPNITKSQHTQGVSRGSSAPLHTTRGGSCQNDQCGGLARDGEALVGSEGRRGLLTMMKRWWSCGCGSNTQNEIQFDAFRL